MDIQMQGVVNLTHVQPFKVELTRGQKGGYGWCVTVYGRTRDDVMADLLNVNNDLVKLYGSNGTTE